MEPHWLAHGEHETPDVRSRGVSCEAAARDPGASAWLTPREVDRAATMHFAKRRNDYLLGRFTAKRAAAAYLGLADHPRTLSRMEVVNDSDGAPHLHLDGAPVHAAISLTDRAGWCVCTLAPAELDVGCDLELVEPRSDAFVRDYLTREEQAIVAQARNPDSRHEIANLIWCAKESALKLLRTGLRRDTRSVRISLGDLSGGGCRAGWHPLGVDLVEGGRFPGWWRRFGCFVLSVVTSRPSAHPRALGDAIALERAVPSHAWLEAPLVRRP